MSKQQDNLQSKTNVQLLMKAEQEASEIVKEAKKRRVQKLKKAEDEAKEEIIAFQHELEQQLQEYKSKHLQTDFSKEINVRKEKDMKEIKQKVEEKKLDAIDFIVQQVIHVDL